MRKFFSIHYEKVLLAISLGFLAIVLVFLFFGVRGLIVSITSAINFKASDDQVVNFNLEGAKNLNLTGN